MSSSSGILGNSLALVGPGKAGRAFASSWIAAGGRISTIVARQPASVGAIGLGGGIVRGAHDEQFPACDIAILAVPDDAIAGVAGRLAGRLSCRFAFHLSGALASSVLEELARAGAAVGSIHPVRPFTGAAREDWRGAFVAVEGEEPAAETGAEIARAVGARPYRLSIEAKPLYHAGASLAAGGTAAVVSVAVRNWVTAGIPEDIAREALAGLASRAAAAVGERPFAEALTGAVARRDVGTVASHAAALARDGEALDLYRMLSEEILRRTPRRGREEEVRDLLRRAKKPR